jgi:hypothetical protein
VKDVQGGKLVFECDSCDAVLETDASPSEWTAAKACLDREGWMAHQVGNDWIHGCPKHAGVR